MLQQTNSVYGAYLLI